MEKQERGERLVLRRRCDVPVGREPAEKRRYFRRAHLCRMALPMEEDVVADPVPVSLLRPPAVMPLSDRFPEALHEFLWLFVRRRRQRNSWSALEIGRAHV